MCKKIKNLGKKVHLLSFINSNQSLIFIKKIKHKKMKNLGKYTFYYL